MSIGGRVVLPVTFQQVDHAPDTKTGAQRHYESLQNTNCTVEKCHNKILLKMCLIYSFLSISYTSKLSVGFTTARCFFMYRSMSKTFLGSASAVYL